MLPEASHLTSRISIPSGGECGECGHQRKTGAPGCPEVSWGVWGCPGVWWWWGDKYCKLSLGEGWAGQMGGRPCHFLISPGMRPWWWWSPLGLCPHCHLPSITALQYTAFHPDLNSSSTRYHNITILFSHIWKQNWNNIHEAKLKLPTNFYLKETQIIPAILMWGRHVVIFSDSGEFWSI